MWRLTLAEARKLGLIEEEIPQKKKKSCQTNRRTLAQQKLFEIVASRYPEAQAECRGAVPGRRFRLDVAIERVKLAIECDGWQYHGKFKNGFHRDRERDRLLTLQGWRILRFAASTILKHPWDVAQTVSEAVERIEREKRGAS